MKLIIFFITLLAGNVLSGESTDKEVGPTLASIWIKNSSTVFTFVQFGSIISEKHILFEIGSGLINKAHLERQIIGVNYGLYDATKVNIGNIDYPKKIIRYTDDPKLFVALLEMDKIGCNAQLVCLPSFFDFNKKPIIGSFIESGQIKTFDVFIHYPLESCEVLLDYTYTLLYGKEVCLKRKDNTIRSSATPFHWFNTENKKWYLVGVQWFREHPFQKVGAYNVSYFKPWIQKTVEDGTFDALLFPC